MGAVTLGSLVVFVVVAVQDVAPVGVLLRDPQTTTRSPWYLGVVSNLGLVGWTVAATAFLGAAAVCRSLGARAAVRRALWVPGVLTVLLLVDDMILLHDDLLQRSVDLELVPYAVYLAVAAVWLIAFRREVLSGPWLLAGVAAAGLAASAALDVLLAQVTSDWRLVLEEGAKFFGIWMWALYAVTWALVSIVRTPASHRGRHPAGVADS